jgi:signal transduction histidine kinase
MNPDPHSTAIPLGPVLSAHYDPGLVVLSVVIVILSFYASQGVADRIRAATRPMAKYAWWFGGSATVGIGNWAMHFIGMLAMTLPIHVSYDLRLTLLSIIPACLPLAVFFHVSQARRRAVTLVAWVILSTLGVVAMHGLGMLAMRGIGHAIVMNFDPTLINLSAIVGILMMYSAVYFNQKLIVTRNSIARTRRVGLLVALLQSAGVAGMHYTAMAATTFHQGEVISAYERMALNPFVLALLVALGSLLVTVLVAIVTIIDQRLQEAALAAETARAHMVEAIETIADGFSLFDNDDRLVICNERYRELMDTGHGITPGMSYAVILRDVAQQGRVLDAVGRIDDWTEDRLERHRAPRGYFVEQWQDNRWFRISERRVRDIGTVGILTDIADLKRAELDLFKTMAEAQRARAIAEDASRTKSSFLANMSHEVRTPMNAIIGYCEMMLEDAQSAGQTETIADLEKIRVASKHLLSLINDILDLSKIEAGKMDLHLEDVQIPALIREVEATIKPLIAIKSNQLIINCPDLLPDLRTDQTKLRQSLLNLLSNACKFTEQGSITLTVTQEHQEGRDGFRFQVTDTGIGMTAEQASRIFAAFTQADASTTRQFGGTGLGLTITREFCRMLGGDIHVDSQPGIGSTFSIWIPQAVPKVIDAKQTTVDPAPTPTFKPTATPASTRNGRILVVDDNELNRDILVRTLQRQGHQSVTAEHGLIAIDLLRKHAFDLVLLDVMMPQMDGYAVLAHMKADPAMRQLPVIMISALTELDSVIKCIEMGADDYLPKPFDPTLLRARIDALLEKTRLRQQEQTYREQVLRNEATIERHRSLAQMVAGVAHEINTPLGIASTALSVIEHRLKSPQIKALINDHPEQQETLDDILELTTLLKNNVQRAHKLVEAFKKISVGQVTERKETVNLPALLADTIELFKINAREARLTITLDSSRIKGSPDWHGYPGYLTQVILNFLQNIERYAYAEGQGGKVEITVADRCDVNPEQFSISVRDFGLGMNADTLAQIFEPFFTTGRNKGGSGLGLAIVRNIVTSALQGRVEVQSEPGQGTTCLVTLPKKTQGSDEDEDSSAAAEAGRVEGQRQGNQAPQ